MKVLLLTTHINIGGVGIYVLNLARGLKKRGIDCFVASSGGDLETYFRADKIPLLKLNIKTKFEFNPKLILPLFKLSRFIKNNDIDIIHSHTRVTQLLGEIASRLTKATFLTTCHGFFRSKRLSRMLFPLWGKKTIAISQAVKRHLIDDFNLPENRISLIYNGIDFKDYSRIMTEKEKEIFKKDLNLGRVPIIGSIGRLSPVKGYKYILFAMKDLRKTMDIRLLLIGDGPSENKLRDLTKKLNLEDSVYFIKSTLDTWKFLSLMDVFIFPSLQEGLGLSLIEAMASGKACIATSVGEIKDIIENEKNGLLVPPGDAHSLAVAVEKILSDKGLLSRLEEKARKSVKDRFSLDKMVDETIKFYEGARNEK